ncbi:MAG: hypothetical protein JSU63_12735 [Phycisphaerales bacterium]|nr:MAG: hypothetical protein JSU63_12735 [Phycisphaerales bacterium]
MITLSPCKLMPRLANATTVTYPTRNGGTVARHGLRFWWGGVLLFAGLVTLSGCGYTGGKLAYVLGFGREQVVSAQFNLTDGPVAILVDDLDASIDWPDASRHLVEELGQELIKRKAAKKIVPRRTLDHLRQSDPGFDKRGCREVGELAGAEQVLWIESRDFLAQTDIQDAARAAYWIVTVKVVNALEKEQRSRVRLWPVGSDGHPLAVQLPGDTVIRLKKRDAIAKVLAGRLAVEITKLFCDHRPGDFDSK